MRKILLFFSAALLVTSGVFWFSLTSSGSTAIALDSATPTAFPLPTQVFSKNPSTITFTTEDGEIAEGEVIVREGESPSFDAGELVTETDHFSFHSKQGYLPVDLESFSLEAEAIFDYVSARLEATTEIKTLIMFQRPDRIACPNRGITVFSADENEPRLITIYADENTSHTQVLGVLAHEIGHVLEDIGHGRRWLSPHRALTEGMATWAAGQYWDGWKETSFDELVRTYLDDATYLPLYEDMDLSLAYVGQDCVEKRDILYTEWASFIDFLLTTYGMDRLEVLFRSSPPEEGVIDGEEVFIYRPPDFVGVYGSALNQLEVGWLNQLMAKR